MYAYTYTYVYTIYIYVYLSTLSILETVTHPRGLDSYPLCQAGRRHSAHRPIKSNYLLERCVSIAYLFTCTSFGSFSSPNGRVAVGVGVRVGAAVGFQRPQLVGCQFQKLCFDHSLWSFGVGNLLRVFRRSVVWYASIRRRRRTRQT